MTQVETPISYSSGIDALCPHPLPCECGSGSNLRGEGHSDYCQLSTEGTYEPSVDMSPMAELASGNKTAIRDILVPKGYTYNADFGVTGELITFFSGEYAEAMSGAVLLLNGLSKPVWLMLEPTQYNDKGWQTHMVRRPIKDDRRDYLNKLYTLHGEEVCD